MEHKFEHTEDTEHVNFSINTSNQLLNSTFMYIIRIMKFWKHIILLEKKTKKYKIT